MHRAGARGCGTVSLGVLCGLAGMTRQNYYKVRRVRARMGVEEGLVLSLVRQERARQPRLGARKLWHMLRGELAAAGVALGRDRFFGLLGGAGLLLPRVRRGARTTDSRHGWRVYGNRAKELVLAGPHELLVSDITYVRTLEGFMYVCLVMDAFSRKIVGWDGSDSLELEGALRALAMAAGQLPAGHGAMHHSDRGCQYCSGAYVGVLASHGIVISMTEENHCYENAKAERLNGVLKQEYGLGATFRTKGEVLAGLREAVELYNGHRPHGSLGYRVPAAVHAVAA